MVGISILQDSSQKAKLDQTVTLADGRKLGFAEFGSSREDATQVFFFHGRPGSRHQAAWFHEDACEMNMRIIAVDRPGFGVSSLQPSRKVLDWPTDLREMANLLKIKQYYIIGYSAGGPYALACAYVLPKTELLGVGILAGLGPYETVIAECTISQRMNFNLSYYAPWMARYMLKLTYAEFIDGTDDEKMTESFLRNASSVDREYFHERPEKVLFIPKSVAETFRQGLDTVLEEKNMLAMDWGFPLESIQEHNIRLWHGTRDTNVPLGMARFLDEHLPHSELRVFEGDTHYTINRHSTQILKDLIAPS